MDNLWKKESTRDGAQYVDLFSAQHQMAQYIKCFGNMNIMPNNKDNKYSTTLHQRGNEFFRAKKWSEAMDSYNESLCYAEIGSENVALTYTSRSSCFFQMRMYEEALTDIEFAKKSNLPDRLLPTLEHRHQECRKLMQTAQKSKMTRDFKLSYEAHKNYPCLADVVEIKYSQEFGRHLVAKSDIPVGKIVLMEKEFVAASDNEQIRCCTCFRKNANFIACTQCSAAIFCDSDCMNQNLWHKWECGSFVTQVRSKEKVPVRAILMAIESFPNVESLMEFVDSTLREDPETIPTSIHDMKTNYHFFFKLKRLAPAEAIKMAYIEFKCLTGIPKINNSFNTIGKKRFLMHLVAHHSGILVANAIGNGYNDSTMINVFSMANHSCAPNILTYPVKGHFIYETIRFVKKGEQLCFNYLGRFNPETDERQKILESKWKFICKCAACKPAKNIVNARLASDPRFKFVRNNVHEKRLAPKNLNKSRQFLNEHGQLPWSEEVALMSEVFSGLTVTLYVNPL
ncbi:SET and MYND domain-containing protein 4-like [Sitodiplosis mosellana]|uniref:SET and MYND domain-containing protein 4-like n=1 Tax=Sitodiplosis mosellana TaxID=263140 RepID=UPI002443FEE2|nr:SET and MYND domain-containing protein 4-like [Sitodiplosis mosellana]